MAELENLSEIFKTKFKTVPKKKLILAYSALFEIIILKFFLWTLFSESQLQLGQAKNQHQFNRAYLTDFQPDYSIKAK